jgi:putative spermidine/putrescine transport system permease protein
MPAVTGLYLIYLFLPLILLLMGSMGEVWTNTLLPAGWTTHWYLELWLDGSFQRAFRVSLEVTLAVIWICTLLAVPLAYALYRGSARGIRAAGRILFLLPIAVPPVVLGFGFILIFSTDALPWLGSIWLLVAAHVVLTLPYLLSTLLADMRHLNLTDLELVAETLGASFGQRFFHIFLPLIRHSLATGLITVAAISIGEFQISNLVAGFLSRPYPVVLLQAFYGATGFACAATVVLLLIALAAALGAAWTARTAQSQAGCHGC